MPNWDVSLVTDMSGWDNGPRGFHGLSSFNADISKWNTSALMAMNAMFEGTTSFQQDIGGWKTEKNISGWDTSGITAMNAMFRGATAFNHDISLWTGDAATTQQPYMFEGANAFQAKFNCTDAVTSPASSCEGPSPIPDASWHTFVAECLAESAAIEVTGACID
ncbi:unnamed protein product [Bathycoccus prasinos]